MSNWLVIGDTSFTGAAFVRHLREQGHAVAGASLRTSEALAFCEVGGWDYVVNFAALNVVAPSWEHPAQYVWVNAAKQIALWDAMRKNPPKRYIHISTPEVYGNTSFMVSEDRPFNPSTPYASSRAAAEMLLQNYVRQYNFPAVITRAANVYGPHQQLYRLIPKLIHTILSGGKFPLEGGGNSVRGFVHVDDCARAIQMLADRGVPGLAYHIATANVLPISAYVRLICEHMGVSYESIVEETPDRPGKDAVYWLNPGRMFGMGWAPRITFLDGVDQVIHWMRNDWASIKNMPTNYVFKP